MQSRQLPDPLQSYTMNIPNVAPLPCQPASRGNKTPLHISLEKFDSSSHRANWKWVKLAHLQTMIEETTVTSIYKSYNFLKQGSLQCVSQSTELWIAVLCLPGACLTWPEQHSCGRLYKAWIIPDSCLITEYSFFLFPFFFSLILPLSLSDYSPWQHTKKSKKTHQLY